MLNKIEVDGNKFVFNKWEYGELVESILVIAASEEEAEEKLCEALNIESVENPYYLDEQYDIEIDTIIL
jgi:hypothetical protein